MSRRLAVLASSAVLVALTGCRPGGDEEITVSDRAIPFTFDVRKSFSKASVRPETTKGAPPLLVYKLDQLNLIDVRKAASRELARDDIERQVARSPASASRDDAVSEKSTTGSKWPASRSRTS